MIETIMMTASLIILGYAFYMSSNLFWIYKSNKGYNKWIFSVASAFIFSSYVLFAFVMFGFLTEMFTSYSVLNLVNIVLGIYLLSGALLIGAMMKYYTTTIKGSIISNVQNELRFYAKGKEKNKKVDQEKVKLLKDIMNLQEELDTIKSINRFAAGTDLRVIELQKKIENLEKGPKNHRDN